MPNLKKKTQATMSESNCSQPHAKPAKRAKKSMSTKVESACQSFSRTLRLDDISKESPTSVDTPRSADKSMLSIGEGNEADVMGKMPAAEDNTHVKERHTELDTYNALFGPEGQIMTSGHPRHYDIFEMHRGMRTRRRKQQQDTGNELFGDGTPSKKPPSSTTSDVTYNRLFGENLLTSENESPAQTSGISQHWDVFEPYREMKRRPKSHRGDSIDTHAELFGEAPTVTVRNPVKNPVRFSRNTPKIVEDVVYKHLQPLLGDQMPPLKTGKACPKSNEPPRNPLTGDGFTAPSRNSIVMPDRRHMLKPAAEGVTVTDQHNRNPVTGAGIPVPSSIISPNGRKQLRTSSACFAFSSQFVISDDPGASPTGTDDDLSKSCYGKWQSDAHVRMFGNRRIPTNGYIEGPAETIEPGLCRGDSSTLPEDTDGDPLNRCSGRWQSDAHIRMFGNRRYPTNGFVENAAEPIEPEERTEQRQSTSVKSAFEFDDDESNEAIRKCRKRHLRPTYKEDRQQVLAWSKSNGNVDNGRCYIGNPPMIRRAAARDHGIMSPITGDVAGDKIANAEELMAPVQDDQPVDVARDGCGAADDCDCYYCDGDDNDDDDDDDENEEDDDNSQQN